MLIAVGGIPGSGKSTLARALAARLGAALLDLDTLTNPLLALLAAGTGAGDDLDHPSLRGAVRDARYRCLADTAAEVLSAGCSVIAVAPFTTELAEPVAWQEFSGFRIDEAITSVLICVHVDPAVARQRRSDRGLPRDQSLGQPELAARTPPAPSRAAPTLAAEPKTPHLCADGAVDPQREAERLVGLIADTPGGSG